ncbi:MAG: bi-domain-containing oxidoreductase [Candidatus Krumholzibacteria bacterium]|nr:bi-domain-containing oxidoreductase [Candidatus Krumholzibacteria bacterium]
MKQVLQSLKTGKIELIDCPTPAIAPGHVLIQTAASVISAGTERMLLEFGEANLISKARQQPDKVRMVLDKIKTDGVLPTLDAVRSKLDEPLAMGYCNSGKVAELGEGVSGFAIGDRVVSNGHHAEMVSVPVNLCAKIPENVDDESAAFTVMGAIALHGIRLAQPTLGETFVVTGLGLIGLIAVQLLRAHGCRVLGIDFKPRNLELARKFGAETVDPNKDGDPVAIAMSYSRGRGVDGVIVTASSKSSDPIHQAATMCRKRGRIIMVGATGMQLSRSDFYEKELTFQVSCSYGPGRYDANYEERGQDYPLGFVRWTEQRNFEAVLDMMADGRLHVEPLISHRFPLAQAENAYEVLKRDSSSLGILLEYPQGAQESESPTAPVVRLRPQDEQDRRAPAQPVVGFIGAGNYATRVLIPAFKKVGATLRCVVSSGGVSGVHAGRKFGFQRTTTSVQDVIGDADINTVVIATRHDSHASYVCEALRAGKHVFVEKPLAISQQQLGQIQEEYAARLASSSSPPHLMVGFNRRFAPHATHIKRLLETVNEPKTFIMTVNAGDVSADHWSQDPAVGGGRIIGEGCHFVDLLRFLSGYPVVSVRAATTASAPGVASLRDKVSFTLVFSDGSVGTVHYLSSGHRSFPKERLEIFCRGRILQLDNFRRIKSFGWPGLRSRKLLKQDKGQNQCVAAFVNAVNKGGPSPISFDEMVEVTRVSLQVAEAASR